VVAFGKGLASPAAGDAQTLLDVLRDVLVNRAGVSFLFGYTELRQQVENHVGSDFQLPRELVDANLLHK
jgi:hypothetical protein